MADEISLIPKDYKEKGRDLKSILPKMGILGIVLIVISLLIYGGLFFYSRSLTSQLAEIRARAEELDEQRDEEFEVKVKSLDKVLKNSQALINEHVYWSNIFIEIEQLTVPKVSFSDFKGILDQSGLVALTFGGKAASYTDLAKQMKSFDQQPSVVEIKVSGISLGTEGGIEFGLSIAFKKDVLLK